MSYYVINKYSNFYTFQPSYNLLYTYHGMANIIIILATEKSSADETGTTINIISYSHCALQPSCILNFRFINYVFESMMQHKIKSQTAFQSPAAYNIFNSLYLLLDSYE